MKKNEAYESVLDAFDAKRAEINEKKRLAAIERQKYLENLKDHVRHNHGDLILYKLKKEIADQEDITFTYQVKLDKPGEVQVGDVEMFQVLVVEMLTHFGFNVKGEVKVYDYMDVKYYVYTFIFDHNEE